MLWHVSRDHTHREIIESIAITAMKTVTADIATYVIEAFQCSVSYLLYNEIN